MRQITVSVGPLAAAAATGIALSQTVPAAATLVMGGASATEYAVSSIALSQTLLGAGPVTLNGAKVVNGIAYLDPFDDRVIIVSAGNDTGINFTVAGIGSDGLTSIVETIKGANVSATSTTNSFYKVLSITASGATAAAITVGHQGNVTLDKPRRVLITTGGNDSGITYTIYGLDRAGNTILETLTGPNISTAYTSQDFLTVTSVRSSGASAGTVTVGTNGVAASGWISVDSWAMSQISVQCDAVGTVNYTVQSTLDNPNDPTNPVTPALVTWINTNDPVGVGATGSIQTNFAYPPTFARVLLNSGTGSVTMTLTQASSVVL